MNFLEIVREILRERLLGPVRPIPHGLAGQVTPIHDHRGVLGGMAILSRNVLEERFTVPKDLPALADSRVRPEGDLSETGPTVLHRLIPQSRAVSLYVYRPPLRTMGIRDARGGVPEIRPSEFDVGEEVVARAVAVERTSPAPLVHEVR